MYDLQEIEHAYAPPYSSAKDPVNIAGYIAENMIDGLVKVITPQELTTLDRTNTFLLDVRTKEEFALGSIDGAVNIPVDDLRGRLQEIPRNRSIVVFCAVGLRGYLAYRILVQNGYTDVKNLSGGYKTIEYTIAPQPMRIFSGMWSALTT